jgi:hypothetical protein
MRNRSDWHRVDFSLRQQIKSQQLDSNIPLDSAYPLFEGLGFHLSRPDRADHHRLSSQPASLIIAVIASSARQTAPSVECPRKQNRGGTESRYQVRPVPLPWVKRSQAHAAVAELCHFSDGLTILLRVGIICTRYLAGSTYILKVASTYPDWSRQSRGAHVVALRLARMCADLIQNAS